MLDLDAITGRAWGVSASEGQSQLAGMIILPTADFMDLLLEIRTLRQDLAAAQRVASGLAERVAAQSELLTQRAERTAGPRLPSASG